MDDVPERLGPHDSLLMSWSLHQCHQQDYADENDYMRRFRALPAPLALLWCCQLMLYFILLGYPDVFGAHEPLGAHIGLGGTVVVVMLGSAATLWCFVQ